MLCFLLNPDTERQGEPQDLRHPEARGRDALVHQDDTRRRLSARADIKKNSVGRIIEEQGLMFPPEEWGPREYHEATRGYILNEVFRRVEPEGRTMGEFLR